MKAIWLALACIFALLPFAVRRAVLPVGADSAETDDRAAETSFRSGGGGSRHSSARDERIVSRAVREVDTGVAFHREASLPETIHRSVTLPRGLRIGRSNSAGRSAGRSAAWAAPSPFPQPAVWVESSDPSGLSIQQLAEIQIAAEDLRDRIVSSGLDPTSTLYQDLWLEAVVDSDRAFRQRHGGRAWLRHHIEAYHLCRSSGSE